jgi:hypothetical protein
MLSVSSWIFCVGAYVQLKGCPGVGFGPGSAFSSVRLALERLAQRDLVSSGPARGVGELM